jgi:hypothetical protein
VDETDTVEPSESDGSHSVSNGPTDDPVLDAPGGVEPELQPNASLADRLLRFSTTQELMVELDNIGWDTAVSQFSQSDIQRIVSRFDAAALVSQASIRLGWGSENAAEETALAIPTLEASQSVVNEGEQFTVSVVSGEPNQRYTWFIDNQPEAVSNLWDFSGVCLIGHAFTVRR